MPETLERDRSQPATAAESQEDRVERSDLKTTGLFALLTIVAAGAAAFVSTQVGATHILATALTVVAAGIVIVAYILPDPNKRLKVIGHIAPILGVLGAIVVALGATGFIGTASEAPAPVHHVVPGGKKVNIFNKVTSGPRLMREDTPVRLFFSTSLCHQSSCVLQGTDYHTGNVLDGVVCQTVGQRMTNGDDTSHSDDKNPGLAHTRLWYGVRTDLHRLAYFSAIWVDPHERNGLGLPDCSSINPA
jgi:hypothetical protein